MRSAADLAPREPASQPHLSLCRLALSERAASDPPPASQTAKGLLPTQAAPSSCTAAAASSSRPPQRRTASRGLHTHLSFSPPALPCHSLTPPLPSVFLCRGGCPPAPLPSLATTRVTLSQSVICCFDFCAMCDTRMDPRRESLQTVECMHTWGGAHVHSQASTPFASLHHPQLPPLLPPPARPTPSSPYAPPCPTQLPTVHPPPPAAWPAACPPPPPGRPA